MAFIAVDMGKLGVEENASKVFDAPDALASAAVLNANGPSTGHGGSLFVINLCASMAPIANVGKSLPGLESYRLYQVSRREDGRTRHRLRLGFFANEADAENVLNSVRASYPTAFTTCLCDEDRRFARDYLPEPSAAPVAPAAPKIAVVVENKPKPNAPAPASKPATPVAAKVEPAIDLDSTAKHPALKQAAKPAPTQAARPTPVVAPAFKTQDVIKSPAKVEKPAVVDRKPASPPPSDKTSGRQDVIDKPSNLLATIELTLESEPAATSAPARIAASSNEPFRVSKGVDIPAISLTLDAEPAKPAAKPTTPPPAARSAPIAKPAPAPAAKVPPAAAKPAEVAKPKPAAVAAPAEVTKPKPAAAPPPAAPMKPAAKLLSSLPDLDSTQTIRALTSDELADDAQEKWYAIQLAISDQPVNLDAMPRLDIFEAYRLYSVAHAGSGKITHCLRIGFFREEVSAEAVCGYLKTFFNSPTVVRISIAEQARFKDPLDRSPSAATGRSPSAGAQERPGAAALQRPSTPKPSPKSEAKVLDLSHARERTAKPIPTVTMAVETPRFDPNATGSFKANATGTHKALSTGAHNALSATGAHKALSATGTHKALNPSSKSASKSSTGKHKALQSKKSLSEQLLDEAREVELSASGIRKLPKSNSLLSKMFGKRK